MGKKKAEMVIWLDTGLMGTLDKFDESNTEQGYCFLKFYELDSILPKRHTHPTPIPKDRIFTINSFSNAKGIEDRFHIIYTGDANSLMKNIFDDKLIKENIELKKKVEQLRIQVASSRQSEEEARSGVKKQIASLEQLKQRRESEGLPFINRFERRPSHDEEFGGW